MCAPFRELILHTYGLFYQLLISIIQQLVGDYSLAVSMFETLSNNRDVMPTYIPYFSLSPYSVKVDLLPGVSTRGVPEGQTSIARLFKERVRELLTSSESVDLGHRLRTTRSLASNLLSRLLKIIRLCKYFSES